VSSPVVVGETIVIGAGDGNVYALDLTTGKERWRVRTGGKVRAAPKSCRPRCWPARLRVLPRHWIPGADADSLARFLADRIADGIPRTDDSGGLRVMSARVIGPGCWVIGFRSSVLPDRRLLQLRRHAIAGR
jgi:hypothetical protein